MEAPSAPPPRLTKLLTHYLNSNICLDAEEERARAGAHLRRRALGKTPPPWRGGAVEDGIEGSIPSKADWTCAARI